MQNLKIKKILFICLFTVFSFTSCNFALGQTPIQEQLDIIEQEVWGTNFGQEGDLERIERIEKQIFGINNPKLTPEKRIDKITKSLGIETLEEAKSSLSELYVPEKEGSGVEYPQIDRLEGVLLGSIYKNENIYVRLERLEKKVFGAKQEGDLGDRTEALKRQTQIGMYDDPSSSYSTSYSDRQPTRYDYVHDGEDVKLQIAALENMVFATDFSQEPVQLRLGRLENKIFQRDFSDDDPSTRIARLQAAATAGKTAKYYDNNKFQKFAATGMQAASFLLMILAFIL